MSNQINTNYNLTDAIIRQTEKINSTGNATASPQKTSRGETFQEILDRQLNNSSTNQVSFSKHANQRTEERNIQISQTDLNKLGDACDKADQKGIKDALVMMNDAAYIVNAQNRVVITVMDKNELKDNVFTNIDGAVFV
jgi:flagellar operon protein